MSQYGSADQKYQIIKLSLKCFTLEFAILIAIVEEMNGAGVFIHLLVVTNFLEKLLKLVEKSPRFKWETTALLDAWLMHA